MPKYYLFDIIHYYGASVRISIPDGVENAEAVAQAYLNDLEYQGMLNPRTEYLETELDFVEEIDSKEFENSSYTLTPTLEELEPFANTPLRHPTKNGWVSVKDYLPASDTRLLVYVQNENQDGEDADGIVNIDNYSTKYGFACEQDNKHRSNKITVTHWMALTKPA